MPEKWQRQSQPHPTGCYTPWHSTEPCSPVLGRVASTRSVGAFPFECMVIPGGGADSVHLRAIKSGFSIWKTRNHNWILLETETPEVSKHSFALLEKNKESPWPSGTSWHPALDLGCVIADISNTEEAIRAVTHWCFRWDYQSKSGLI